MVQKIWYREKETLEKMKCIVCKPTITTRVCSTIGFFDVFAFDITYILWLLHILS